MGVCETVTHRSKAREEVPLLCLSGSPSGLLLASWVARSSGCCFGWRWRWVWEGEGTRAGHWEQRGAAWQPSVTARGLRWAPGSRAVPHRDRQDSQGFSDASWLPHSLLWPPAASPSTHCGCMIVFEQGRVSFFSSLTLSPAKIFVTFILSQETFIKTQRRGAIRLEKLLTRIHPDMCTCRCAPARPPLAPRECCEPRALPGRRTLSTFL